MLNPNRLEELGFVYSLNEDNHSDETWTLGENTMKYNRTHNLIATDQPDVAPLYVYKTSLAAWMVSDFEEGSHLQVGDTL